MKLKDSHRILIVLFICLGLGVFTLYRLGYFSKDVMKKEYHDREFIYPIEEDTLI